MLPRPSWVDGTYPEAVEQLATKAAVNNVLGVEKRADAGQGALGQLGSFWQNMNPAARNAIIGAGAGGLLGAGRSLTNEDERPSLLSNVITGGIAGAGIGGGGTLAMQGLQKGFGPSEAGKMPVKIDGKTIMLTPDQAQQIQTSLQPTTGQQVASGVGDLASKHPYLTGLGAAGAGEAAYSNIAREAAPGSRGLMDLLSMGRVSPGGSRMRAGLQEALAGKTPAWLEGLATGPLNTSGGSGAAYRAAQQLPAGVRDRLARMGLAQGGGMAARLAKSLGGRGLLYGLPLLALAGGSSYFEGKGKQDATKELLNQLQSQS